MVTSPPTSRYSPSACKRPIAFGHSRATVAATCGLSAARCRAGRSAARASDSGVPSGSTSTPASSAAASTCQAIRPMMSTRPPRRARGAGKDRSVLSSRARSLRSSRPARPARASSTVQRSRRRTWRTRGFVASAPWSTTCSIAAAGKARSIRFRSVRVGATSAWPPSEQADPPRLAGRLSSSSASGPGRSAWPAPTAAGRRPAPPSGSRPAGPTSRGRPPESGRAS